MQDQDPYKYFRVEARELLDGLSHGVLELEKGLADRERINSMLRLAHTLKGAARVVKQPGMAELAHSIEDMLSSYREERRPAAASRPDEMLQVLDEIARRLAALGPAPVIKMPGNARPDAEEPLETVRVEVEEVEALLRRMSEAGAKLAAVENEAEEVRRAKRTAALLLQQLGTRADERNGAGRNRILAGQLFDCLQRVSRRLGENLEQAGREFAQARELANRIRLLPAAVIFPPLAHAVRDAAQMLGKNVRFEPAGGGIRLDAQVLTTMRSALLHLVRNAVAHGIEADERRIQAGKAPVGQIDLAVERRGDRVGFVCRDDGAGIDLAAIRRAAVRKGVIAAAAAENLALREAIDLLLRGGLSTARRVDEIAGRGIGLDIVRAAVERLKGEISVESEADRGTTIEICVPVSLTSVAALQVNASGIAASLPLDSVRRTGRYERSEIACCGAQESIAFEGRPIPFLRLSRALGLQQSGGKGERGSLVVIAAGGGLAAIGVDHLMGAGAALVRVLPALMPVPQIVSGATLDYEGNPQLFLDAVGLVAAANQDAPVRVEARETPLAPILVIDDSLTTRTVEQSILESAGYRVDVATSGEQALEMALERRHSLFLVDVEMPGIDGFEFISRTRADPGLRETPAILVTSRTSDEDRRRGVEAGARAYIVKSEFEQGQFLQTIRRLVST